MCKLVPVLRVIGFVFLVLAIVACAIGFVAPFWIRLPLDDDHGESTTTTTALGLQGAEQKTTTEKPPEEDEGWPTTTVSGTGFNVGEKLSGLLKNGSYQGLWAKCFHNFSCSCFWQNDFAMEKEFPGTDGISSTRLYIAQTKSGQLGLPTTKWRKQTRCSAAQ